MTTNHQNKITHYNPHQKNPPELELFMQRARDGFYAVLRDEGIRLTDRKTNTYIVRNGDHLLTHYLDGKTFSYVQYFRAKTGRSLTYWLKQKFETGDLKAIERAYGFSFHEK
ncbi:MAG: hypothetical protein ACOYN2_06955 [Patescibacteria group bacterium]